jgi:hypothetical protein
MIACFVESLNIIIPTFIALATGKTAVILRFTHVFGYTELIADTISCAMVLVFGVIGIILAISEYKKRNGG